MRGFEQFSLSRVRLTALACVAVLSVTVAGPQARAEQARGARLTPILSSAVGAARAVESGSILTPVDSGRNILAEVVQLPARYTGDGAAARLIASGEARPTTAADVDADGDGVRDLAIGYAFAEGGAVAVYRGNAAAVYPNSPEAQERRAAGALVDAPFLGEVAVFATAVAPDLIAAGDFDLDMREDLAVAARGGTSIYVFSAREDGSFGSPVELEPGGAVTALAAGEFGRRDAAADLVAGVASGETFALTVFASPSGALRALPASTALAAPVADLHFGRYGADPWLDIAVASGNDLVVVHGGRGLAGGSGVALSRRSYASPLVAVTGATANATGIDPIAVLTTDGVLAALDPGDGSADVGAWPEAAVSSVAVPGATRLVAAHLTGAPEADLVLIDPASRLLHVVEGSAVAAKAAVDPVVFRVDAEPTAIHSMRLDGDALSDLVVLRAERMAPAAFTAARRATFTVTTNADSGPGSLRQAILEANAAAGADVITFAIAGGNTSIALASPLPAVTGATGIDATTQPGFNGTPIVELNGTGAGAGANGLILEGGQSVVRGLVINRFAGNGIFVQGAGGNIIEGNYIGTNAAGTADFGNAGDGVLIRGVGDNRVGGATAAARNVISGNNSDGIQVDTAGASDNLILGNYIGTSAGGNAAIPNSGNGIVLSTGAVGTEIGGAAGAGNVVSGNGQNGIFIATAAVSNTVITNNNIGTNAASSAGLPNLAQGIAIEGADTTVSANLIAFNAGNGIFVGTAGTSNTFSANSIGNNGLLGIDLAPVGVTPNDAGDGDTGANELQNFPVVTGAQSTGNTTTISGTLNSAPSTSYVIQFFANTACDPSGFGEGETFLGSTTVMTNQAGAASFSAVVNVALASTLGITATATDPNGNTSEFSACTLVATSADLTLTIASTPNPVPSGNTVTYTYTVTNTGPLPAEEVLFLGSTPSGTTFVSLASPGTGCVTPAVGGVGTIECDLGTLAPNASVVLTVVVRVVGPSGQNVVNSAFVTSLTPDPDTENNSATNTVSVIAAPVITSIVKLTAPGKPFRVKINGENFQPGAQVFIGTDRIPWPNVRFKNSTMLVVKKGGALKARFPKGVAVPIRVLNPDGGEDTATFTR